MRLRSDRRVGFDDIDLPFPSQPLGYPPAVTQSTFKGDGITHVGTCNSQQGAPYEARRAQSTPGDCIRSAICESIRGRRQRRPFSSRKVRGFIHTSVLTDTDITR